jgi:hypothetical protein
LSLEGAGLASKQGHMGSRQSKSQPAGAHSHWSNGPATFST